jgi:hypothetical protein
MFIDFLQSWSNRSSQANLWIDRRQDYHRVARFVFVVEVSRSMGNKGERLTSRYRYEKFSSMKVPGVAASIAATISGMGNRTTGHCGVLNTTMASFRPVRFAGIAYSCRR